jgi:hypothetical protein
MKNAITIILLALSFLSCAKTKQVAQVTAQDGKNGVNGFSCSTEQTSFGAIVKCTDGTFSYLYNGLDGETGEKGNSCSVAGSSLGATITCEDGSSTFVSNGLNGTNGVGCTVQQLSNGAKVTCGTQVAVISNGTDASLPSGALYIKEIVNPCGSNFANDEVFLRLSDNRLIALYDGGSNLDRLTVIAAGSYRTTDDNNHYCTFNVTSDYQITNQVYH